MRDHTSTPPAAAIILGAMKAGTTQLFHTLAAHPEVIGSALKEPNFFINHPYGGNWWRGGDWYQSLFRNDPGLRLEASTAYTKDHLDDQAALRIRMLCPDVKLIYLVRDPVDRAVSHYLHNVTEGRERSPIQEALLDPESAYNTVGLYYRQLTPYLRLFPSSQILVVQAELLWQAPELTLAEILRFLGIRVIDLPLAAQRHATADRIASLRGVSPGSPLPPFEPGKGPGARILGEMAGLTPELRTRMAEFFVDDQRQLREIHARKVTGRVQETEMNVPLGRL